jgi:hypothetical protein
MEAKMTKLTDTQLMMLSKASQREDRAVECPPNLKGGALKAVVTKLLDRRLLNEIAAKRGMPAWRQEDEGASFALVITRAGLKAIAAEPEEQAGQEPARDHGSPDSGSSRGAKVHSKRPPAEGSGKKSRIGVPNQSATDRPENRPEFRTGSKQALILAMLRKKGGASLSELQSATGWLPHTTRAALTGLRKRGHILSRERDEKRGSVYRIEAATSGSQE